MDARGLLEAEVKPRRPPESARIPTAEGNNRKEYLSVDDMLVKHVGEFGLAQFFHFVLVSLAWTVEALHTMVMIFGDRVPEWQCLPQPLFSLQRVNSTSLPSAPLCTPSSDFCELDRSAWEWAGGKSVSTVSEWDLICGEGYKAGLAGSLFFIGVLLGAGIYGSLSDSFLGRKGSLALSCVTTVSLGLLTALAPSFWVYASLRFLTGLNTGGIGLCSFVLATELVGPNKRGSVGMSAFYFFSSGIMVLSLFGYFTSTWRMLYLTTSIPGILFCSMVMPFVWESPRWYLVKGRLGDAMKVLRAVAKWNGATVPDSAALRLDCHADAEEGAQRGKSAVGSAQQGEESVSLTSGAGVGPQNSESRVRLEKKEGGGGGGGYWDSWNLEASIPTEGKLAVEFPEQGEQYVSFIPAASRPTQISDSRLLRLEKEKEGEDGKQEQEQSVGSLVDVFRYGETRWRMLIMVCIWFITGMVYYGISLNVVNLNFNLYVSVFVNGFIEVPAFAITAILLGKLGRKAMLVVAMVLSGVCCLIGSFFFSMDTGNPNGISLTGSSVLHRMASGGTFLPELDMAETTGLMSSGGLMGVLRLSCGVLGIFGMAGTYNLIYIYTAELFPTVVRNAALGLASQAAGVGSVIAPFIVVVGHFNPSLPFLVFGALALAGAGLATRLPETLSQPLHDTMEGLERAESRKQVAPPETGARITVESR